MLETYFSASKLLVHLRSGPSGPYLDGFAAALERQGYSADTAVRYLRAAAHLGHVVAQQGTLPNHIDLTAFSEHLCTCRCPRPMGGRGNHHTIFGARLFREHLVAIGVCQPAAALQHPEPSLVAHFKIWLRKHRGASDRTIKLYARDATHLMAALGDESEGWESAAIRSFFLDRAGHCGSGTVEKLTTSLRAFLRYLAVKGRCRADLADVVPGYAHWRLADAPRYLAPEQVIRLIAACDGEVVARRRDRAIVLLLARLGLRAGDVAQLRLNDIEWETGSLRVSGKSRYEVRLPLPQDVGDAIAAYLADRPSTCPSGSRIPAQYRSRLNTTAPSVQRHYNAFNPTTGCSAPVPHISTSGLAGTAHSTISLSIGTTGSPVPCKSLFQVHAAYQPDAVRAGLQDSAQTDPGVNTAPGSDIIDTVSTSHRRFAFARLPGPHLTGSSPAFSATLTTIALYDSSSRRFGADS